eukprot:Plantae.Rhodophyta-Purpureofilum_apyrenoidigerum.ctg4450.p1 GENE.Plantae.Rhodophyta-Purpureofilum_apyrenoidigerum.ctg4450~~Plantae.Rhodophyta-Purpureofilum_apyrenoidigerum.ctg4450.p1  ORF type:complete len:101 (+),score=1.67 Plantae.Rhodophyta-Purpureofilum_apyrenoidigerum.ctg4450:313-615(+)
MPLLLPNRYTYLQVLFKVAKVGRPLGIHKINTTNGVRGTVAFDPALSCTFSRFAAAICDSISSVEYALDSRSSGTKPSLQVGQNIDRAVHISIHATWNMC